MLVQALRGDRLLPERSRPPRFAETLQGRIRVLAQNAEEGLHVGVLETSAALDQFRVLLHQARGAPDVRVCALDLERLGAQVKGNVKTPFEQLQVLVKLPEELFDPFSKLDTRFHKKGESPADLLATGHGVNWDGSGREGQVWRAPVGTLMS